MEKKSSNKRFKGGRGVVGRGGAEIEGKGKSTAKEGKNINKWLSCRNGTVDSGINPVTVEIRKCGSFQNTN